MLGELASSLTSFQHQSSFVKVNILQRQRSLSFNCFFIGIPTLVALESAVASVVQRLTSEPEFFLVPVTPSSSAVKQVCSLKKLWVLAIAPDIESLEFLEKIPLHELEINFSPF